MMFKEVIGSEILRHTADSKDIVSLRLTEVGEFLIDRNSIDPGTDMGSRMGRIEESFRIFGENFFFGIMPKAGSNFYAMSKYGIGSHGEITDALGRYGIVGFLPYVLMYIFAAKEDRAIQSKKTGFAYIITFIFLAMFNPCFYSHSNIVWFMIIPGINYLYALSEQKGV